MRFLDITHAAVIIAGIGSLLQCIEIKIPYTPYQIGTGTASLLGNSHIMLSIFLNRIMLALSIPLCSLYRVDL